MQPLGVTGSHMNRLIFTLTGAAALMIAVQAGATPCTTTIVFPNGDGVEPFSALGTGVCVDAGDKLFSNFKFGNLNVPHGTVTFALEVLSPDNHDITFTDQFTAGGHYTGFGYTVTSTGSPITSLLADYTQTTTSTKATASTLTENTIPTGAGSIDLSKTGIFPTGTAEIDYTPGVVSLIVTESLLVGNKENVSAILNTVVQDAPEPGSLLLLGGALAGFAVARRQRRRGT
jgi:hypothetical protein